MINFEEEIKRFKPCLEIEDTEESIYSYDSKDVSDILQEMIKEIRNDNK
ncbi:MAG: hypothetical protein N4A63_01995 [Vallitalea sp.]|jgi:hypothetical protein|nr:hypothetical protein [Vallitalea sp.]